MSTAGHAGSGEDDVAGAHAGYHDQTRQHRPPDVLVDDVVTYRMLAPHLMRAGLFLVTPTVLLLVWLLLGYLASMSSPSSSATAITSIIGFLVVVLYLAGVAAFFAPAKEPIAEYSRLVEGRAAAAPAAHDRVRHAAEARRTPAELRESTVAGVPVLVFSQRSERAMLLVQPYGEDLYVGWTMWRSRSSATLLGHFLRDTFGRFAATPRFSSELRAASTRALRESVHSLSREGVAAALSTATSFAAPRTSQASAHRPAPDPMARPDPAPRWSEGSWEAAPGPSEEHGRVGGAARGDALPPASPHTPSAWTPAEPEEELYAPRRSRRDEQAGDAGWGPPPRH